MNSTLIRSAVLIATFGIPAAVIGQQAATTPPDLGAPPSWDVLMRPRTHAPTPTTGAITAADLRTRLFIFADDSMQGRLLATAGNVKGVEYIAGELKRMGLTPAGDNGTFFQSVDVVDRAFDAGSKLVVGSTEFAPWTDYVLRDQGSNARSLNGAQAVFGGTWGDSASLIDPSATVGKIVVLRINANGVT